MSVETQPQHPTLEVRDPRFRQFVFGHVSLEKLHTGSRWAEGPAWFAAGRYLVLSLIHI